MIPTNDILIPMIHFNGDEKSKLMVPRKNISGLAEVERDGKLSTRCTFNKAVYYSARWSTETAEIELPIEQAQDLIDDIEQKYLEKRYKQMRESRLNIL